MFIVNLYKFIPYNLQKCMKEMSTNLEKKIGNKKSQKLKFKKVKMKNLSDENIKIFKMLF